MQKIFGLLNSVIGREVTPSPPTPGASGAQSFWELVDGQIRGGLIPQLIRLAFIYCLVIKLTMLLVHTKPLRLTYFYKKTNILYILMNEMITFLLNEIFYYEP